MKTMRTGLLAWMSALAIFAAAPQAVADSPARVAQTGGARMDAKEMGSSSWLLVTTVAGLSVAMGMLGQKRMS